MTNPEDVISVLRRLCGDAFEGRRLHPPDSSYRFWITSYHRLTFWSQVGKNSETAKIVTTRREFLLLAGSSVVARTVPADAEQLFLLPGKDAPTPGNSTSVAVVWKNDVAGGDVELTYAQPESAVPFALHPGIKRL